MPHPAAILLALAALAGAALVALLRAQPREACPLCGRKHALELHP